MTTSQSVKIDGSGNTVTNVGGDWTQKAYFNVDSEVGFFTAEYEGIEQTGLPHSPVIPPLMNVVQKQRLVMLVGSPQIDKEGIARNVASMLQKEISLAESAENSRPVIKEWYGNSSVSNFSSVFFKYPSNTIFVLPDIAPQHLNHSIAQLQKAVVSQNCFIIATTNIYDWGEVSDDERKIYWQNLNIDEAYPNDFITELLVHGLGSTLFELPFNLPEHIVADTLLLEDLSIAEITSKLKTPSSIDFFVQNLGRMTKPVRAGEIRELLDKAQDSKAVVGQWYHNLTERQQLFSAALALCDGLFDDQFFGVLEYLVSSNWRKRDPLLTAYDYHDLDRALPVFRSISSASEGIKIESQLEYHQSTLLKLIWNTHRRYIISSLPFLAELIIDSANKNPHNTEVLGSNLKREQVQFVLGKSISEIAIISSRDTNENSPAQLATPVENALIRLAANESSKIQNVAAIAMAKWCEQGRQDILFSTLKRWQTESRILDLVNAYISAHLTENDETEDDEPEETFTGLSFIRATVAITVAYAVFYDEPNKLSSELLSLIDDLADDDDKLVQDRFCSFTLPFSVSLHVTQLEPRLRKLIMNAEHIVPVSYGLALGHRSNAEEVNRLIESWLAEVQDLPITESTSNPQRREAMLATLALTDGFIEVNADTGTDGTAIQRLKYILENKNEHPFVRKSAIEAVNLITTENFHQTSVHLAELIPNLANSECDRLVEILTSSYLEQRTQLSGGEKTIRVEDKTYDIWINSPRPLTDIENLLHAWILESGNLDVEQVGLQCFVSFANHLDKYEIERIEHFRAKEKTKAETSSENKLSKSPVIKRDEGRSRVRPEIGLLGQIILWFVSRAFSPSYRPLVSSLVPEAYKHDRVNEGTMKAVFTVWSNSNIDKLSQVSEYLKRVLNAIRGGWIWICFLIVIGVVLAMLANG